MNKGLLEVYALSVCFVSVGCLSIFSGILLYSLVEISFPAAMKSVHFIPSPMFSQSGVNMGSPFLAQEVECNTDRHKSFEEQQKGFERNEEKRIKSESIKSIIRSVIIIFIASLIFIFHWRIAKDARSSEA